LSTGERTVSHFHQEDVHRYLNIDVYKRNPTQVPSMVVQKHGRPSEGYYQQRNPSRMLFCLINFIVFVHLSQKPTLPLVLNEELLKSAFQLVLRFLAFWSISCFWSHINKSPINILEPKSANSNCFKGPRISMWLLVVKKKCTVTNAHRWSEATVSSVCSV